MTVQILVGDCRALLRSLPAKSVHTCCTSPPYWGLRDYKIAPSIWGGDLTCTHEFAEKQIKTEIGKGNWTQGVNGRGERQPGGVDAKRQPIYGVTERGFCIHCNAWRGCYGLEPTYQLYIEHTVEIFREVWRVLRDDGTLWLNMGDCYANSRAGWSAQRYMDEERDDRTFRDKPFNTFTRGMGSKNERIGKVQKPGSTSPTNNGFRSIDWAYRSNALAGGAGEKGRKGSNRAQRGDGNGGIAYGPMEQPNRQPQFGMKQKDKCLMPARVAIALQEDGWYVRQDNVWHKRNPMPESTGDRPTTAHEFVFLFSKSGDTLCWRHEDGRWLFKKPEADLRWRHRKTRLVTAIEPTGRGSKHWFRFNLWRGYDYYYDAYAIMEPSSPDSHARAARARSKAHKHSNGSDISGKPHAIAVGSPSAGRVLPIPTGWDEGDGHHGAVHRDGRRQEVGVGNNGRPTKGVPNGAGRRALPAEWKGGGPNSRFNKDRVPRERKSDAHAGTYADQDGPRPKNNANFDLHLGSADLVAFRNKRSVWSIATKPFKEAHFATFPPKLIEPCILAGCPRGGTVLDPFGGAGTTGLVAQEHGRNAILIEINPEYAAMAEARIKAALMGPEEKARHVTKRSGKLQTVKELPLFAKRKTVTRDIAQEPA